MKETGPGIGTVQHTGISFHNVSFSYVKKEAGDPLMAGLNFEVGEGEFLGIIGPSASGKSTLLKLLMGLYQPDRGEVRIGGHLLADYQVDALRDILGYVPQKAQLFRGTIAENLRYGNPRAELEDMERACRDACIDSFIREQPEAYESLIEEGGSNLSGGQRQRMCLARALIRSPRILVMDNMTSALDRITEQMVCRNLQQHYAHITKVVVSDRISSIRDADRILVLDRGRIAGIGSHDQLMENCPLYREMVQTQERSVSDV